MGEQSFGGGATASSQHTTELIAGWRPSCAPGTVPAATDVALVRRIVADARPRSLPEARTALRCAWAYLCYRRAHQLCVEPGTAFAAEEVDAYKATLTGAVGTTAAVSSYLKRLHPGVGLAGTTRPASNAGESETAAAVRVGAEVAETDVAETAGPITVVPAGVAAVLADHRPQRLGSELWDAVAEVTRCIVAKAAPQRPERAVHLMTEVAYLAAWVHAEHRPLEVATVLAGRTIEEFLTLLLRGERSLGGVATMAANLHAVRQANDVACDVMRRQFPGRGAKAPYGPDELDRIYAQVARIPHPKRRAYLRAGLALVLGAGAGPGECGWVTPEAVMRSADDVRVGLCVPGRWDARFDVSTEAELASVECRWVSVLDEYADDVLAAKAHALETEQRFLVGGTTAVRNQRLNQMVQGANGCWRVEFDQSRARATWLVEAHLSGRYPVITELMDAAGITSLERVQGVLGDIRARAEERGERKAVMATIAEMLGQAEAQDVPGEAA